VVRRRPAQHNPFMAANVVNRATFVIGAENTNVINVGIQLKDADNNAITQRACVRAYMSADANGDTLATAPNGGLVIGTDGLCIEEKADQSFALISEANGHIDLNITESGTPTMYIVLVMPDGSLVVSGAITFA
jgi:hypothetical protein